MYFDGDIKWLFSAKHNERLFADECDCDRRQTIDEWTQMAKCDDVRPVDLDRWQDGSVDFAHVLKRARTRWFDRRYRYSIAICHYKIVDNQVICAFAIIYSSLFADLSSMLRRIYRLQNVRRSNSHITRTQNAPTEYAISNEFRRLAIRNEYRRRQFIDTGDELAWINAECRHCAANV